MDSPHDKKPEHAHAQRPRVSATTDRDARLKALGQAMRARRKAAGVSQEELALTAGVDRAHMGKIERGERNVTALNILRIADALGCRVSDIFVAAGL